MKKKFFKVITRAKALSLFDTISLKDKERIITKESLGRILGSTITAPCNVPNFDRSTMDGYAVIADDTYGSSESSPVTLIVKDEVVMGRKADMRIQKGEGVVIPTGGMIPQGADAVVMIENTKRKGELIAIKKAVAPLENIVEKGSDIKKGDLLLEEGRIIRAQDLGVLYSCGIEEIDVFKKPRVSIISTGDELVSPEMKPKPGEIRGINTYTLYALTERYGGEPVDLGIAKDSMNEIKELIEIGISKSDIIVISGGSSVGTKDITLDCITAFNGSDVLANGLALKPGKPTILAKIDNKPVIGLPGHPVSCMVIFYLILKPLILKMMSYKERFGDKTSIRAMVSQNIPSVSGREEYIRVRLKEENGAVWAEPVPGGSGVISSLSRADGLVRIDLESEGVEKGEMVDVLFM
ncbi:molybdopterin molybdotransferase MoeA [candidate division WOR-3 bacterium]|nr:molybdopterin molybdotransferase MoeA [candidate division WOR-3 bacterium]